MNKIQEVATRIAAVVTEDPTAVSSSFLDTIIQIVLALLTAGGLCGMSGEVAQRRMKRQGPIVLVSIWRTVMHMESNPALWEPLKAGIVQVGGELTAEDYAAMLSEAKSL